MTFTNSFQFCVGRNRVVEALPVLLPICLVVLFLYSLKLGRYPIPFVDVARIVFTTSPINATGDYTNAPWVVVEIVRMPRILLVTLCGMGLAMSGAAMQGVFRNPLVGPEIAGVSSGAALGGVAAIMLSWPTFGIVGLAFGSGLLALAAAFGLASLAGRASTLALVLSGVIVGGFCGALVGLMQTLADPMVKTPLDRLLAARQFRRRDLRESRARRRRHARRRHASAGAALAHKSALARRNRRQGARRQCRAVALDADGARRLASRGAGFGFGGVGWVGLIVPHLARMLVGPEHTRLLPTAAFLGGIYLLGMDDIARSLTEQEIPIGLLTSVVGTPIFAFLFWKTQSKGWTHDD